MMCLVIELNALKFEGWENGSLKFIQEKLHLNFSNLSIWTEALCCMNMTGTVDGEFGWTEILQCQRNWFILIQKRFYICHGTAHLTFVYP